MFIVVFIVLDFYVWCKLSASEGVTISPNREVDTPLGLGILLPSRIIYVCSRIEYKNMKSIIMVMKSSWRGNLLVKFPWNSSWQKVEMEWSYQLCLPFCLEVWCDWSTEWFPKVWFCEVLAKTINVGEHSGFKRKLFE